MNQNNKKNTDVGCIVFWVICGIISIIISSKEKLMETGNTIIYLIGLIVTGLIIWAVYSFLKNILNKEEVHSHSSKSKSKSKSKSYNDKKSCWILIATVIIGLLVFNFITYKAEGLLYSDSSLAIGIIAIIVISIIIGLFMSND